jgi:hypothetical protein
MLMRPRAWADYAPYLVALVPTATPSVAENTDGPGSNR